MKKKNLIKLWCFFKTDIHKKRLKYITNTIVKINNSKKYKLLSEEKNLKKYLASTDNLKKELYDFIEIYNLAKIEKDKNLINELNLQFNKIKLEIDYLQTTSIFTSENDSLNTFMEIQAGAGGVDAQDWVDILFKMYASWFNKKSFNYNILDITHGDPVGIKYISIKITGKYAYGWLKSESGIHRLVRKSPFNANKKRHTSFASVLIYPEKLEKKTCKINESDLKINTYRSSGAGGQHVNKTDSAVRITHVPTNITVQCQSERSQHKNKIEALNQLKFKINMLQLLNNISEKDLNSKPSITWGNQIRSYIIDKSYIKDNRLTEELNNINVILNGNLDTIILSILTS